MILINREFVQVLGRQQERYRVGMTVQSFDGTKMDTLWMAGTTIAANGLGFSLTNIPDDAALMSEEAAMHTANCVKILTRSKTLGYNATNQHEFYKACGEEMYFCGLEKFRKDPAKPVNFRPVVPIYPKKSNS